MVGEREGKGELENKRRRFFDELCGRGGGGGGGWRGVGGVYGWVYYVVSELGRGKG